MRRFLVALLVAAFTMLSAACVNFMRQESVTCEHLIDKALLHTPVDQLNQDNIRHWIQQQFGIRDSEIGMDDLADGSKLFVWKKGSKEYRALFMPSGRRKVTIVWVSSKPTLDRVVQCFGVPELYQASLEPTEYGDALLFSIWYPKQGWVVGTARLERAAKPPQIRGDLIMDDIVVTMPGPDAQALLQGAYPQLFEPEYWPDEVDQVLRSLRPWPDSLADVIVTVK